MNYLLGVCGAMEIGKGLRMGQGLCGLQGGNYKILPAKWAKTEGCPCAYNLGIEPSVRLVLPILMPIIAGGG